MNAYIDKFYSEEISLNDLISKLGINNTIFEMKKASENKYRLYTICDKNDSMRYSGDYKIYLLSTDLESTDWFYMSDLAYILRNQEKYNLRVSVHYRGDIVDKKYSKYRKYRGILSFFKGHQHLK